MSLRTRQGLGLVASIMLMAAACTGGTATPTPAAATPPSATATPAPIATPTPVSATGTPVATPAPTATTAVPSETASAPASSNPTPVTSATPGGSLVMGEWQPVSQLNPFFTTAFTSFEALGPVLHGLLTIDNDGNWSPDLATEVPSIANGDLVINPSAPADCTTTLTQNPDGTTNKDGEPTGTCFTLTLKLKPGLMWSDGTPLTMNDFFATYNWASTVGQAGVGCTGCSTFVPLILPLKCVTAACLKDSSTAGPEDLAAEYAADNQYIKSITVAADGLSAVVVWQKNFAGWLGWASSAFLQGTWLQGVTAANATTSMPVGAGIEAVPWSGPFKIIDASADGIDYARNDDWKASAPALLDTLKFKYYADVNGEKTDFLNGALDLAFDMTQADYPSIQGVDPSIGKAELDPAWQYEHFDLQTAHASVGLDDVKVRTAIAMAVNKPDMLSVLFPGQNVQPACSNAPPGTPWRDDTVTCAAYDPAGAMAMLQADGWAAPASLKLAGTPSASGLWEKTAADGTDEQIRLHMCTSAGNPTRLTELGKMNEYLTAIGIPSDIQTVDAGSVLFTGWTKNPANCSIYGGTYDIADYAYIIGADIYGDYYYTYDSAQIPETNHNGSNDTRLNNPDMDAALSKLGFDVDPVAQLADGSTVQQVIATENNEIPLYYRAETTGVGVHVGGWTTYNPSSVGPTWNAETWYFVP